MPKQSDLAGVDGVIYGNTLPPNGNTFTLQRRIAKPVPLEARHDGPYQSYDSLHTNAYAITKKNSPEVITQNTQATAQTLTVNPTIGQVVGIAVAMFLVYMFLVKRSL